MGTVQLSPPTAPFSRIKNPGESITINTAGKILVLPTGNLTILPNFNEYALNTNRLTIAESPFGGLKGAGSPDYAVGTLFTATDGVYLTDINGNNSTKTLTAGKLKEVSSLTVDSTAKTITEEFIIKNDSINNNAYDLGICGNATGWSFIDGVGVGDTPITSDGTKITVSATSGAVNGMILLQKTITSIDLTNYNFLTFTINSNVAGSAMWAIGSNASNRVTQNNSKPYYNISVNTNSKIVCPIKAPVNASSGANPNSMVGVPVWNAVTIIRIGVLISPGTTATFSFSGVSVDVGKNAFVEIQCPDFLSDSSLTLQCYTGVGATGYETCGVYKLDSVYSLVSATTANWKYLDGTSVNDLYGTGSGQGRSVFPKGVRYPLTGSTVAGSAGTMTYSANYGTSKRTGVMVSLPPSDSGRTNFNKVRLKTILSYTDTNGNTVPDLSLNDNTGTITGGVTKLSNGFLFDGVSGKINCGSGSSLNLSSAITISALVKPDSVTGHRVIAFDTLANTNIPIEFEIQDGVPKFLSFIAGNPVSRVSGTAINAGDKIRITATFDSSLVTGACKMYQGSSQTGISDVRTLIPSRTGTLNIGYYNASYIFSGTIYDVQIWNRALSSSEITSLNNGQEIPSGQVLNYKLNAINSGSTTYEFADSTNASYGLQNLVKPWIALYDPAGNYIDFFLFTHRPKNLVRKRDDSGNIYEMTLYPGNGSIYRGRITNALLTADSNSNLIPDCLESSIEGSVTKFLSTYDFSVSPTAIEFYTTGQTFAPVLQTTGSPTILWTFSDASTDATATPSKDFGTTAVRKHTLVVTPWSGLLTINVGYNADDDGEIAGQGSNLTAVTPQNVSGIKNIHLASALTKLACSRNPINYLDVSNLTTLQKIEAFNAFLTSIVLKNNIGLKRLCVEECDLSTLDLTECLNLEDLRCAYQQHWHINITWSTEVYPALRHVCIRDQMNDTFPQLANIPQLRVLYMWGIYYSGTLDLSPISGIAEVIASYNTITNVIMPANLSNLVKLLFDTNALTQAAVDSVLAACDNSGLNGKFLWLDNNTAPSAAGLTHKANLISKGWTVTTD